MATVEAVLSHSWFRYTPRRLPIALVAFSSVLVLPRGRKSNLWRRWQGPARGTKSCPCRGGGRFHAVELRVLVLRRLVQNEASGLCGLVEDVTDPRDGHPQCWWRHNQPRGEGGHQFALALARCKCASISDRRARCEKQYFDFLLIPV
jgi:hypothetical protein